MLQDEQREQDRMRAWFGDNLYDKPSPAPQRKEPDHRLKWDMPDTGPEYHYHSDSFLLWFLPQFVQHVGEVMVGVSLCRFIELYGDRIPELIQLLFPK